MDKIKAAVIGVGLYGDVHARTYAKDPCTELACIWSRTEDHARTVAQKYQCRMTTDLNEIAEDRDIKIVSIATPDFAHTAPAVRMLEAGKHVLLEKPMAMYLDDQPISWPPPVIKAVITDGNAQITGNFTSDEAKQLSIQLNAGALPVPLKIESQTRVGPTIGAGSIQKSIFATVVGLLSVALFMVIYYRILGIFAVLALFIYTLIVFAIFKIIPVTLTLAGIAGFVLSIGMAVDANILIFERIKEEVRWGKPKHEALFAGFNRAWSSIRDSNVSSLITTVILFNFGTGSIRGFALTLAIGILISMFSAIMVTRTFLRLVYKN